MIKSKGYYCDLPRLLLFYSCETRLRGYEDETGQIGYGVMAVQKAREKSELFLAKS